MADHHSSLNNQTPFADADNAVEKAENAVKQVLSHKTHSTIAQANNALSHAENAVHAAQSLDDPIAVERLNARFAQAQQTLANTQGD